MGLKKPALVIAAAAASMFIVGANVSLADDPAPDGTNTGSEPSVSCGLDKVSTINEVNAAEAQRIEVGGGGTQHVDYYPDRGVNTISYVVGPREPVLWWGFGSIWEGQCTEPDFAYLADAAGYAHGSDWQPGRLNNGHSGVVMDTRDCTLFDTLWDSLDEDQQAERSQFIDDLLATHRASQDTILCPDLSAADVQAYNVEGNQANDESGSTGNLTAANTNGDTGPNFSEDDGDAGLSCKTGARKDFASNFEDRKTWHINTGNRWAAVNFWSNWTDPNYGDVSFLLAPDTEVYLKGGGDVTFISGDCTPEEAETIRAGSANEHIQFEDLPSRFVDNS